MVTKDRISSSVVAVSILGLLFPCHLIELADGQELNIEGHRFLVLDTPGHAEHHCAFVFENRIGFSGDVAGVRLPGPFHLRVPMPPPEFHLEKWRASVRRLQSAQFSHLAAAHFGIFDNAAEHLAVLARELDQVEEFMQRVLPQNPTLEEITRQFLDLTAARAFREGLPDPLIAAYEAANPSWMSAAGMQRYWTKWRDGYSRPHPRSEAIAVLANFEQEASALRRAPQPPRIPAHVAIGFGPITAPRL